MFGRDELSILRREQGRWRALGIVDYDFEYMKSCFCPIEMTQRKRIEVRGGKVIGVFDKATGAVIDQPYWVWPTVDSLFVWLERDIRSDYNVKVSYDGTYHFPSHVNGDIPMAVDDEYIQSASNLVKVGQ